MSNYIVIDKDGLEALFPAGSEARLKLTDTIIKQFSLGVVQSYKDEVSEEIKKSLRPELDYFKQSLVTMRKEIISDFTNTNSKLSETEINRLQFNIRNELRVNYIAAVNALLKEADTQLVEHLQKYTATVVTASEKRITELCKKAGEHMAEKGLVEALNSIIEED